METLHSAAAFVRKEEAREQQAREQQASGVAADAGADDAAAMLAKQALTKATKDPFRAVRVRVLQAARLADPAGPGPDGQEYVGLPSTGFMSPQAIGYCRVLAAGAGELRDLQTGVPRKAIEAAEAARQVVELNRQAVKPVATEQVGIDDDGTAPSAKHEVEEEKGIEMDRGGAVSSRVRTRDVYPRNPALGRAPRLRAGSKAPALPPSPPSSVDIERLCPVPRVGAAMERRALRILLRAVDRHRRAVAAAARELHGVRERGGAPVSIPDRASDPEVGSGAGGAGGSGKKSRGRGGGGRGAKGQAEGGSSSGARSGGSRGQGQGGGASASACVDDGHVEEVRSGSGAAAEAGRRAVVAYCILTSRALEASEVTVREALGRLDLDEADAGTSNDGEGDAPTVASD